MKQKLFLMLAFFSMQISVVGQTKVLPFTKGFNLHDWFENFDDITDIKFKKFIRQDFENMKALGCDHVRLPVEFFGAVGSAPDFKIDPMLFMFIDEVADWSEELEMYLIIDNHSFSDKVSTKPEVVDTLLAIWLQVAGHFKNRSDFIIYEVLNEPHGIADDVWNSIQLQTINAIRTEDKKHTIIVGPAEWYNYNHLYQMPEYSDTNLVYTFHFYDPFLFTTASDIVIPYPYDPGEMPDMPDDWIGSWFEDLYDEYPSQGNDGYLYQLIDTAINFREIRNAPVYCGEFGVNMLNCEKEDRVHWISTVRTYLEEHNIPWTMWSYTDYMGIFDPATPQLFEYNMDTSIVKALGLTPPTQKKFRILPDTASFFLYDDYIPQYIVESSWLSGGSAQYYSQDSPKEGKFCILWSNVGLYGNLGFRFYPKHDLSQLRLENYVLDFWMRCNTQDIRIELRFEDSDTGDLDHPWRNSVTLDNSLAAFDGTWQHVKVPLTDFIETGAWEDNTLYPPEGKFDWTNIERFDFVAEYSHLHNVDFFFDQIQIADPSVVALPETHTVPDYKDPVLSVYLDIHNMSIYISFSIPATLPINISLFDMEGREIATITRQIYNLGDHTLVWKRDNLVHGIYFVQLQSGNFSIARKILVSHK